LIFLAVIGSAASLFAVILTSDFVAEQAAQQLNFYAVICFNCIVPDAYCLLFLLFIFRLFKQSYLNKFFLNISLVLDRIYAQVANYYEKAAFWFLARDDHRLFF
jgi:hypothetical protein